jgi:isochorismate hydrolase
LSKNPGFFFLISTFEIQNMRSSELLSASTSRLLIVDMQEKLLAVMKETASVTDNCVKLIRGARVLSVPVDATEQYPRGLGGTAEAIADLIPQRPEKMRFSCSEAVEWAGQGTSSDQPFQIVLAGIEAHVCVLQTAFDLLANGFEVFVVADAVMSRHRTDYEFGLKRMSDAGIHLVTTEMVLFEWCEIAGTDDFKKISRIITNRE